MQRYKGGGGGGLGDDAHFGYGSRFMTNFSRAAIAALDVFALVSLRAATANAC